MSPSSCRHGIQPIKHNSRALAPLAVSFTGLNERLPDRLSDDDEDCCFDYYDDGMNDDAGLVSAARIYRPRQKILRLR
jgi:hypothetical protein